MRVRARSPLLIAGAVALVSSLAAAEEPPAGVAGTAQSDTGRSRSHLILAGVVAASFLVVGAVAGRRKGGPASRRSLRPSGRGPLQKS